MSNPRTLAARDGALVLSTLSNNVLKVNLNPVIFADGFDDTP